jgi:superfamily II RNA helicase
MELFLDVDSMRNYPCLCRERGGYEKYDKLSAEVKAMISRKEYENMHFRSSEDDEDDDDGGLLPVVVFSFSKKKVEEIADHCRGLDLLTQTEKGEVRALMQHVYSHLNPLDAQLPQVIRVGDMLSRGIGVHHGGLLPILKEAVELLFSKSIVKVLFATETFAMGVNMPAKVKVF